MKLASLVCFAALVGQLALGGLTQDQLARFQQQLSDSDPKVRSEALEGVMKVDLPTAGNELVPLLARAIRDPDQAVRAKAAGLLAATALMTTEKFHRSDPAKTDLRSYPPLKELLIGTFHDADEETRKNALAAYALTFEVAPEIQNDLVARFDSERPFSLFRTVILEALIIDGTPTPAAKALLIRVASNPNESVHFADMIKDSKMPPPELLPIFVDQFNAATDSIHRAAFIRAIKPYGVLARPYLPTLERAAEVESDNVTKRNIKEAIAAIQAAK